MLQNYNKILTKHAVFSIIKPRSRSPQKKSAYFTHPDFSEAKIEKKCANYVSKYGNSAKLAEL
jgi:hypothetical protein